MYSCSTNGTQVCKAGCEEAFFRLDCWRVTFGFVLARLPIRGLMLLFQGRSHFRFAIRFWHHVCNPVSLFIEWVD
jgi:hypothetical protein